MLLFLFLVLSLFLVMWIMLILVLIWQMYTISHYSLNARGFFCLKYNPMHLTVVATLLPKLKTGFIPIGHPDLVQVSRPHLALVHGHLAKLLWWPFEVVNKLKKKHHEYGLKIMYMCVFVFATAFFRSCSILMFLLMFDESYWLMVMFCH